MPHSIRGNGLVEVQALVGYNGLVPPAWRARADRCRLAIRKRPAGEAERAAKFRIMDISAAATGGFTCCANMIVLVDYDNVRLGRRGLRYLAARLLDSVGVRRCSAESSIRCRLYGGWFDGDRLSKAAQRLVPEMQSVFPRRMTVSDDASAVRVRVTMELASALIGDRATLTHTYRRRSWPPGIVCRQAPFRGCASPSQCAVAGIEPFMNSNECPHPRCDVAPRSVLGRGEQKLVDSMLVVDLVRLAQAASELIVLVSSDDDMWPGIRGALLHGARVLHVHARRPPPQYRPLTTQTYTRVGADW